MCKKRHSLADTRRHGGAGGAGAVTVTTPWADMYGSLKTEVKSDGASRQPMVAFL